MKLKTFAITSVLGIATVCMSTISMASVCDNSVLKFNNLSSMTISVKIVPTKNSHLVSSSDATFDLASKATKDVKVKSGSGSWGDASGNITANTNKGTSKSQVNYKFYRPSNPTDRLNLHCFVEEKDNKVVSQSNDFLTSAKPSGGGYSDSGVPTVSVEYK
jgi:hypothetical protein